MNRILNESARLCSSRLTLLAASALLVCSRLGHAQEPNIEDTQLKLQATYGWQKHLAFRSAYAGANSLQNSPEKMYTFTGTAYLGFRPWHGGEIYLDPEVAQGVPFSGNLIGLGSFSNGEITRAAGTNPVLYRQRLFLRQTWGFGGDREQIESDFNQMAGQVDKNRFVLTAGNFSTLDMFDGNSYAKDPRTQFSNWSNWTYGAYDYAADARGFGWGLAGEWYQDDWVLRLARMTGPKEPNLLPVDRALGRHYGDQIEIEHAHQLSGRPGKLRVLAWRNRARVASFSDALDYLRQNPGSDPQSFFNVRSGDKTKYGLGFNLEQSLDADSGVFVRAMKADGRTETYAFTEIDASLSAGLSISGNKWRRGEDRFGVAVARNSLSSDRQRFLAAGGISFFIGDGALRYRPETLLETYYSLNLVKGVWLTADYQRIHNPAYNADRGPVNVLALRFHAEY